MRMRVYHARLKHIAAVGEENCSLIPNPAGCFGKSPLTPHFFPMGKGMLAPMREGGHGCRARLLAQNFAPLAGNGFSPRANRSF